MCVVVYFLCFFFFFKQKTAYEMRISDWSSDVCSSDLVFAELQRIFAGPFLARGHAQNALVEGARCGDVADAQHDMVETGDAKFGHAPVAPKTYSSFSPSGSAKKTA